MYILSNVQQVSQLCTPGSHNDYRIGLAHTTCKVLERLMFPPIQNNHHTRTIISHLLNSL